MELLASDRPNPQYELLLALFDEFETEVEHRVDCLKSQNLI
jgi:hypothetical protein